MASPLAGGAVDLAKRAAGSRVARAHRRRVRGRCRRGRFRHADGGCAGGQGCGKFGGLSDFPCGVGHAAGLAGGAVAGGGAGWGAGRYSLPESGGGGPAGYPGAGAVFVELGGHSGRLLPGRTRSASTARADAGGLQQRCRLPATGPIHADAGFAECPTHRPHRRPGSGPASGDRPPARVARGRKRWC